MLTGSAAASSTRTTATVSGSPSTVGNFGFISCKSSSKESMPCFGARRSFSAFLRRSASGSARLVRSGAEARYLVVRAEPVHIAVLLLDGAFFVQRDKPFKDLLVGKQAGQP